MNAYNRHVAAPPPRPMTPRRPLRARIRNRLNSVGLSPGFVGRARTAVTQLGLGGAIHYLLLSQLPRASLRSAGRPDWFKVRHHRFPAPLFGRCRSSDRLVLEQVIIEQHYAPVTRLEDVHLIVDCGANVGYSAAYFLNAYPQSHVVAIEPDDQNFELCAHNLASYGSRVTLLHAGIWSHRAGLKVCRGQFGDGRAWATQVREIRPGERPDVNGIDLRSILDDLEVDRIDILKVDIEEAEAVLFGHNPQRWLNRCRNIAVELHGEDCARIFFDALSGLSYEETRSGDLTLCTNIRQRSPSVHSPPATGEQSSFQTQDRLAS